MPNSVPLLIDVSHIDPCYEYRLRREDESPEDYGLRAANALEEELLRLGPDTVMAFIAEPVVGATTGAVVAAPGYFKTYPRDLRSVRHTSDFG